MMRRLIHQNFRGFLAAGLVVFPGFLLAQDTPQEEAAEGQAPAEEATAEAAVAEEATEPEFPKEVEPGALRFRFAQEQDDGGRVWGVAADGAIGWTQWALKRSMELRVAGQSFSAERSEQLGRGHYVVEGTSGGLRVVRDIRLDFGRGVARVWDRFRPADGAKGGEVVVEYLTTPLGEPAAVLTSSGGAFSKRLGPDDFGLVLRNDTGSFGRTSAVLVFGATRDVVRPSVAWAEDGALRAVYKIRVAAGEETGLVLVVGQRELDEGADAALAFRDLYWRQHLFAAAVPEEGAAQVANFPALALTGKGVLAPKADELVAVLGVEEQLGVERSTRDVLWVGGGAPLVGDAEAGGGEVAMSGAFGELRVPFSAVAALQGGAGQGRRHRVFLRDGTVLGGRASVEGLKVAGGQGWRIQAELEQLDHLLLRLAEEDGEAPEGAGWFVRLHSGDVLPLAADGVPVVPFVTPWGAVDVPLDQVEVMLYVKVPTPRYRLVLRDGSRLTGFVGDVALEGRAGVAGDVEVAMSSVEALWPVGERPALEPGEFLEAESFDDLEPPVDAGGSFVLLRGGNLLAGTLGGGELDLLTGTTVTSVEAASALEVRRDGVADSGELSPEFTVVMGGGHALKGKLRDEFVAVETALGHWSIPVQHVMAVRRGTGEEGTGEGDL